MKEDQSIKIQFPKDESNEVFDGKIHTITPVGLESFLIGNNKFYILNYEEGNQFGITLLRKNKDRQFFKIPLDNYDYLFNYLDTAHVQSEPLTVLNNQNYINTIGIQNAEQLFLSNNLYNEQTIVASASGSPSSPPGGGGTEFSGPPSSPPKSRTKFTFPPDDPLFAVDTPPFPPKPVVESEEFDKEVTLYIGFYGLSYAAYLGIDNKKDIQENKFRFIRYSENKKLNDSIIKFLSTRFSGQESDEIYIDYGKDGEVNYLIDTDLINLTDSVTGELGCLYGKYKYKIIPEEFIDIEDFNKFKSSSWIECIPTEDMHLRSFPETHVTTFFNLASSDIIAKFKDSYGVTVDNSFSEKLDMRVHKSNN